MRRGEQKLGRLVIGPPRDLREEAPRAPLSTAAVWWIVALVVLAAAGLTAGWQTGWLPAQFVPRKVIISGNELTPTSELRSSLGVTGGESYLEWWQAAHAFDGGDSRWLRMARLSPLPGRSVLVRAVERKPVLRVESAGAGYWLCDDGTLEKAQLADHDLELFGAIKQLPVAQLEGVALGDVPPRAGEIMEIAAACNASLSGQIRSLLVLPRGVYSLRDRTGLEIRLGTAADSDLKIAALPKALRALSTERARLDYLDGTGRVLGDKFVFYEVLKEDPARKPR